MESDEEEDEEEHSKNLEVQDVKKPEPKRPRFKVSVTFTSNNCLINVYSLLPQKHLPLSATTPLTKVVKLMMKLRNIVGMRG